MLTNIRYGVIAIVAAMIIGIAGYFVIKGTTPNPSVEEPKIPIRGVFVDAKRLGEEEYVNKIKDIGANWVEIVLWVLVTENGELIPYDDSIYGPPFSMEEIRSRAPTIEGLMATRIQQAHDLGFGVFYAPITSVWVLIMNMETA